MSRSVHVAILGAGGYGAAELLRLCAVHPLVEVVSVTSTSHVGQPLDRVHPHMRGFFELDITDLIDTERLLDAEHSVIFSALPHGASALAIERLLTQLEVNGTLDRVRVIDLSGDFRLKDVQTHAQYYPQTPALPERRRAFVYALPELSRAELRGARWVANPGCLAVASVLAGAPLVTAGFAGVLAIDAKTGSSGSGSQLKETTHHPTRHANFWAYRPLAHRHEPEILQALGDPAGERICTSFVAQSMDVARGIFVTVHLTLPEPSAPALLRERFEDFYADSPFVRVVEDSPELQNVVGSNFCDLAVACRERQVVVMAALDNLVKGMAGMAIQNMNLLCGLPESTGLWAPALRPV
ncbi:MAG: N-acetyl-gamma-glutamyl-phosphate reductase [Planctomycetes bacterium]|nr:N-acetyl-gamma-glutamyl-phosphate reductase [Planctomycetota bacterium]